MTLSYIRRRNWHWKWPLAFLLLSVLAAPAASIFICGQIEVANQLSLAKAAIARGEMGWPDEMRRAIFQAESLSWSRLHLAKTLLADRDPNLRAEGMLMLVRCRSSQSVKLLRLHKSDPSVNHFQPTSG